MIFENKTEEKAWEIIKRLAHDGCGRICDDLDSSEMEIFINEKVKTFDMATESEIDTEIAFQSQVIEWLNNQIDKDALGGLDE